MKTSKLQFSKLCVIGTVAIAAAGILMPAHANSQINLPVSALNGWNGKMGPGLSSVKTPFGVLQTGTLVQKTEQDTMLFDTNNGMGVEETPFAHMGPGLGSSKTPGE